MGLMDIRRMMMESGPHEIPQYETAGPADVVTFESNWAMPMRSLKVGIDPVQDLHGYENPWPGGGGKNKFDPNSTGNMWVGSDMAISYQSLCKSVQLSSSAGQSWSASMSNVRTSTNLLIIVFFDGNNNILSRNLVASGGKTLTATAPANTETVLCSLYRYSEAGDVQFEAGSTATKYEPYSNICPISGRTGANVQRTGKNLLNLVESEMVSKGWNRIFPISLKAGTYIISCRNQFGASVKGASINLTDENDSNIIVALTSGYTFGDSAFIGVTANITENQADKIKNIRFALRAGGGTYNDIAQGNIQLELGSSATDYEPYAGNTYPISWETEAGTVYGGTLDVVSGELVVDRASVDLGTLSWTVFNADMKLFSTNDLVNNKSTNSGAKSSMYPITTQGFAAMSDKTMRGTASDLTLWVIRDTAYTDAATFKAAMNGVQLVYELATPQTYHLTPVEVRTLLGQNNVWADTGQVEVQYWVKE